MRQKRAKESDGGGREKEIQMQLTKGFCLQNLLLKGPRPLTLKGVEHIENALRMLLREEPSHL